MNQNPQGQPYGYPPQPQPAQYPPQPAHYGHAPGVPQQGEFYGDGYTGMADAPEAGDLSHPAVAAFTRRVYTYFATGLATATAAAFGGTQVASSLMAAGNTGAVTGMWIGGTVVFLICYFCAMFSRKSHSPLKVALLYMFAGSFGVSLAPLLMSYVGAGMGMAIVLAFGLATVLFFGLTVFVLATGKDFRGLGSILFMSVLALLGVWVIGMVVGFPSFLVGLLMGAGMIIFIGFTLFDTSRVVRDYYQSNDAVSAAINLLYDFIMLFRYALYFMGVSRD